MQEAICVIDYVSFLQKELNYLEVYNGSLENYTKDKTHLFDAVNFHVGFLLEPLLPVGGRSGLLFDVPVTAIAHEEHHRDDH